MKIRPSIQFKAAFLTIVFLLNTIVGFACAIGMNMGFNSKHLQERMIANSGEHNHLNNEHHYAKHEHGKGDINKHSSKREKDNCCKDQVTKLTKADKLNQAEFKYHLHSFSGFLLSGFNYFNCRSNIIPVNVSNTYFLRQIRPPIPDIRIAIQSFQI